MELRTNDRPEPSHIHVPRPSRGEVQQIDACQSTQLDPRAMLCSQQHTPTDCD
jgi:hypothetical protein